MGPQSSPPCSDSQGVEEGVKGGPGTGGEQCQGENKSWVGQGLLWPRAAWGSAVACRPRLPCGATTEELKPPFSVGVEIQEWELLLQEVCPA